MLLGWVPDEEPPAEWVNFLEALKADWILYLEDLAIAGTDYVPAVAGDAPSGTNFSRSTNPGAISITGTQGWIIPLALRKERRLAAVKIHVVWGSVPPGTGSVAFHLRRRGQGTTTTMASFTISTGEVAGARVITLPAGANLPEDAAALAASYFVFIDNASIPGGTPHQWESVEIEYDLNTTV